VQKKYGFSYVFISHDLSVVKHMCDRIAIMYQGNIVEIGTKEEIFEAPRHPYTKLLLHSILKIDAVHDQATCMRANVYKKETEEELHDSFSNWRLQVDEQIVFEKISETHYVASNK